jgi:uncharacterized membrane-anchored protein YhcB (DUF1043 family)
MIEIYALIGLLIGMQIGPIIALLISIKTMSKND